VAFVLTRHLALQFQQAFRHVVLVPRQPLLGDHLHDLLLEVFPRHGGHVRLRTEGVHVVHHLPTMVKLLLRVERLFQTRHSDLLQHFTRLLLKLAARQIRLPGRFQQMLLQPIEQFRRFCTARLRPVPCFILRLVISIRFGVVDAQPLVSERYLSLFGKTVIAVDYLLMLLQRKF